MSQTPNLRTRTTAAVQFSCELTLTEEEARALAGIFGYNCDAFLEQFYKRMGEAYVKPFENGVRSLHQTVTSQLNPQLDDVDDLRRAIKAARKNL